MGPAQNYYITKTIHHQADKLACNWRYCGPNIIRYQVSLECYYHSNMRQSRRRWRHWSGPDYSSFPFSYRNVSVGQAYFKQNGQPNPGGVYRCTVAGVSHGSGGDDGLTGTDPLATYTSGTAQFKYERQCGPDSDLDYDITSGQHGANGTIIENIHFEASGLDEIVVDYSPIKTRTVPVRHNIGLALLCEPVR